MTLRCRLYFFWSKMGVVAVLAIGLSCENYTEMPCEAPITYSSQIKPIMESSCALQDCHTAGFSLGDFSQYEPLKAKAQDSTLYRMVIALRLMPPVASGATLTEEERERIGCWIAQGAPK